MVEIINVDKIRYRYKIVLNNGDIYYLTRPLYQERPFAPGDEVDEEELKKWITLRQYRSALEKAVSMLAIRACSKGEISQKLKRAGYAEETIEMVLYKLEKNDLVNDRDFASQWASYRSNQNYGPRRIAMELRQKGLSSEETEAALSEMPEEHQLEQAVHLARKGFARARQDEDPRKTLQRVISGIVRRGYDWDTAREACEKAARELNLEEP